MRTDEPIVRKSDRKYLLSHISWGAIFAGAVLAISIQFMLTLLGTGIGLLSVEPGEAGSISAFGTGTGIWFIVTFFTALFFGGLIASRLSANIRSYAGVVNSLVVWSLVVVMNIYMASTGVSKVAGFVTNSVSNITDSVELNLPDIEGFSISRIESEVDEFLAETDNRELKGAVRAEYNDIKNAFRVMAKNLAVSPSDSTEIYRNFKNEVQASLSRINEVFDEKDIKQALTAKTTMTEAEADRAVTNIKTRLDELATDFDQAIDRYQQEALVQAEEAADATGSYALWAFLTLLLGAVAAAIGGKIGIGQTKDEL